MPLSNTIGSYADVQQVLDAALRTKGARYTPPNQHPVRWRARAYHFRSLLMALKQKEVAAFPGVAPTTAYDSMFLTVDGNEVVIEFRNIAQGTLRTLDGKPMDVTVETQAKTDDLEETARRFAEGLDLDG